MRERPWSPNRTVRKPLAKTKVFVTGALSTRDGSEENGNEIETRRKTMFGENEGRGNPLTKTRRPAVHLPGGDDDGIKKDGASLPPVSRSSFGKERNVIMHHNGL